MTKFHDMAGHLIRRAHQVSTAQFNDQMTREGIDITPFQFAAMSAIKLNPGLDQATVAAWAAIDRATIGGVVDRLVEKNYVERSVSPKDRRARVLTLTDSGAEVLKQIEEVARKIQNEITKGLRDEEADTLISLLRKVSQNMPK
jgi:DNA-binding MarR family transcriptional regulator